jgi:hypothetical protein
MKDGDRYFLDKDGLSGLMGYIEYLKGRRDEIIETARNVVMEEDSHACEDFVFSTADEYLSREDESLGPWTEREEE